MSSNTLISVDELATHLADPDWVVVDCRYSLADSQLGRQQYLEQHITGAVYAHLYEDLSSAIVPGKTGRHPWPDASQMVERLSQWGIDARTQVVAYDDGTAALAGRLWWICRWMGHDRVAVLDGGWKAWHEASLPSTSGEEHRTAREFRVNLNNDLILSVEDISAHLGDPTRTLIDSRDPKRYRGEHEPIDPIAGHIPSAINRFHGDNLGADGKFLAPEQLKSQLQALWPDRDPTSVVFYCGSGVSATVNLLACSHAGLTGARLYPGSWSEWIADDKRPIETG